MAESSERRRCPWCWEWIDRNATVCDHCGKEVQPPRSSAPDEATPAPAAAGKVELAPEPTAVPIDPASATAQALWWASALMFFGVLLFGVAFFVQFPSAAAGTALTVGEVVAAYFANRALWTKMKDWPKPKVTRLLAVMAAVVVVLAVSGWVQRRFF